MDDGVNILQCSLIIGRVERIGIYDICTHMCELVHTAVLQIVERKVS